MSSWSDPTETPMRLPELRHGDWTRRGGAAVLGDEITEGLLGDLAARTRAAAQAQGYAVGWAEGRRAALAQADAESRRVAIERAAEDAQRRAEHDDAVAALGAAAEGVRMLLGRLTAAVEDQATDLAWALTEELVGHQLRANTTADTVARVLGALPDTGVATVRLHPSVIGEPAVRDLADRGVTVVRDESLTPVDALVEAAGSVTDLRIGEALQRVREVLG